MYLSYECTIRYGILLRSDPASVNSNALQYFVSFATHSKLCDSSGPSVRNCIQIKMGAVA